MTRPHTSRLTHSLREKLDFGMTADTGLIERAMIQKIAGRKNGARLSETARPSDTPDAPVLTWQLDFGIETDASNLISVILPELTYSGGTISLFGSGFFVADKNFSRITLRGQGSYAGISILILDLRINDAGAITQGRMRYKAFGQRGLVRLPTIPSDCSSPAD